MFPSQDHDDEGSAVAVSPIHSAPGEIGQVGSLQSSTEEPPVPPRPTITVDEDARLTQSPSPTPPSSGVAPSSATTATLATHTTARGSLLSGVPTTLNGSSGQGTSHLGSLYAHGQGGSRGTTTSRSQYMSSASGLDNSGLYSHSFNNDSFLHRTMSSFNGHLLYGDDHHPSVAMARQHADITRLLTEDDPYFSVGAVRGNARPLYSFGFFITANYLGMMILPFAVASGGYLSLLIIPLLFALANLSASIITSHLYNKRRNRVLLTLPDVVETAFGYPGRVVSSILISVTKFFVATAAFTASTQLCASMPSVGPKDLPIVCSACGAFVFLPLVSRTGLVLWHSPVVQVTSALCVVVMVATVVGQAVTYYDNPNVKEPSHALIHWDGLPVSFASFSMLFFAWLDVPQQEFRYPSRGGFLRAMRLTTAVSTILNLLVAAGTYFVFGEGTPVIMMLHQGGTSEHREYHHASTIMCIARIVVAIPLLLFTTCAMVEALRSLEPNRANPFRVRTCGVAVNILLIRLPAVAIMVSLAYINLEHSVSAHPHTVELFAVVGGLFVAPMVFALPLVLHARIRYFVDGRWSFLDGGAMTTVGSERELLIPEIRSGGGYPSGPTKAGGRGDKHSVNHLSPAHPGRNGGTRGGYDDVITNSGTLAGVGGSGSGIYGTLAGGDDDREEASTPLRIAAGIGNSLRSIRAPSVETRQIVKKWLIVSLLVGLAIVIVVVSWYGCLSHTVKHIRI